MLALTLAQWVAAFANLAMFLLFGLVVLAGMRSVSGSSISPRQRLMRERRRHARRTARAMRQMSAIRARTARQMDEAEGWWRP